MRRASACRRFSSAPSASAPLKLAERQSLPRPRWRSRAGLRAAGKAVGVQRRRPRRLDGGDWLLLLRCPRTLGRLVLLHCRFLSCACGWVGVACGAGTCVESFRAIPPSRVDTFDATGKPQPRPRSKCAPSCSPGPRWAAHRTMHALTREPTDTAIDTVIGIECAVSHNHVRPLRRTLQALPTTLRALASHSTRSRERTEWAGADSCAP